MTEEKVFLTEGEEPPIYQLEDLKGKDVYGTFGIFAYGKLCNSKWPDEVEFARVYREWTELINRNTWEQLLRKMVAMKIRKPHPYAT